MSYSKFKTFYMLIGLIVNCTVLTSGQVLYTKIVAYDGSVRDHFGRSVAAVGDYVLIGALLDDNESGSAYLFRREGDSWILETKLVASDRSEGSRFGRSVAIRGDYIAIGAEFESTDAQKAGSVYVFQKSGSDWTEISKLRPATVQGGDHFGTSLALSERFLATGAPRSNGAGSNSGSVFIFELIGGEWVYHSTVTASDAAALDEFGYSCSLEGDDLLVGAWGKASGTGAAYVYHWSGAMWVEEAKLVAGDGNAGDHFGSWWVGISGGRAVIGALGDDDLGPSSGSAYIFSRGQTGWSQEAKLLPGDGQAGDEFGVAASIAGDYALVGSWDGGGTGAAYLFKAEDGQWSEEMRLVPDDVQEHDDFGYALCLLDDLAVIGCDDDVVNAERRGSAYIFTGLTDGVQTLSADIWSDSEPIIIPPGGGTVSYSISITNNTTLVQTSEVWVEMIPPGGNPGLIFGPRTKTIQPGLQIGARKSVEIFPEDPEGVYHFVLNAGTYGGSITATDTLPATKSPVSNGQDHTKARYAQSSLGPVYPNPFNPSTEIRFVLEVDAEVSIVVFSANGEAVKTLMNGFLSSGSRSVVWDGTSDQGNSVPSGVYFVRLLTPSFQGIEKIVLIK